MEKISTGTSLPAADRARAAAALVYIQQQRQDGGGLSLYAIEKITGFWRT
ncbi:MAG: hypothetical protein OXC91_14075 [Rhodobacteraceae bacterium]|nr:hypothetical protein [Paracoccaceae bacterium]